MNHNFIEEKTFTKIDFSENALEKGDYELCTFINCDFSNSDLSIIRFMECEFHECNLSSTNIYQTGFQDVLFESCKMLGMHFEKSSNFAFSIKLNNCQLNFSSFFLQNLSKTVFTKSKLQEVDFSECNLSSSIFDDCDLQNAIFSNTDLRNSDFRTSHNFTIDPENNRMKGAQFSLPSVSGLLHKYNIKISH